MKFLFIYNYDCPALHFRENKYMSMCTHCMHVLSIFPFVYWRPGRLPAQGRGACMHLAVSEQDELPGRRLLYSSELSECTKIC